VAGCLSPLQAYRYLRNTRLDENLRRRFAERLLAYPEALKSQPVLEVALKDRVHGALWQWALAPFAVLCEMDLKWEDHLAVGCAAVFEPPKMPPPSGLPVSHGKIPWRDLVDKMEKAQAAEGEPEIRKIHSLEKPEDKETDFIASYEGGKEWDDLKLLLDTMKALEMKPLIIGVPLGGNGLEAHGVSRAAREHFYQHLRDVCAPYGWPLLDYAEHDMDPGFLIKGTSHYTPKGWLYVNWALDDFYHDQPIKSGVVYQETPGRS
jgi:D-alanine transfer protein